MNGLQWVGCGLFAGLLTLNAVAAPQEGKVEVELTPAASPASSAFSVRPDEDGWIRMPAVLAAFEEATGCTFADDEETRQLIEATTFFASGPIECGPDDALRVFGALLSNQGFVWNVLRPAAPRVLTLRSMKTGAAHGARQDAPHVRAEALAQYADSAGLMIQTVLSLPHTDVRTLSNSLRSVVADPMTLQVIPLGNTNELLIQGFAPNVVDLAAVLFEVDRATSEKAADAPAKARSATIHGARGEFTVQAAGEEQPSLLELVRMHARATGQVAILDEETVRRLSAQGPSLSAPITLSGDAFAVLCEELLRERRFVVTDLSHGAPCVYTVRTSNFTARGVSSLAAFVDAASLASCAARPATMFTTRIELPHVDVRTLSNSMRGMVVNPNLLQIVPVGNTNSLILRGLGRELVELVDLLRSVEAASAEAAARAPRDESEDDE